MNLVAIIMAATLTTPPPKERPKLTLFGSRAITSVVVHGSTVFTLATQTRYGASVIVLRSDLQPDGKALVFLPDQCAGNLGADTRWKIGTSTLWFTTEQTMLGLEPSLQRVEVHRFPLSSVPDRDFLYPYDKDRVPRALGKDSPVVAHNCPLHSSVRQTQIRQHVPNLLRGYHRDQLDFLVRGEWSAEFFFLTDAKIERWSMTTKWDPDADRIPSGKGAWDDRWTEKESFPCTAFDERFRVFEVKTGFVFVTDSGKMFIARHVKEGKRKLERLWSDPKRAIGVLVSDTKSGKTFAFTKPADPKTLAKDELFFELADPIKPQPFDPAKLKPTTAPEPLHTALQHARFLVEQKLIDGK